MKFKINETDLDELKVRVYPPGLFKEFEFVVPQIIPGTYMKVNYARFYSDFTAYDTRGEIMKVSKYDNVFKVEGEQPLLFLEYTVKQSLGNKKVWNNSIPCAGTIITKKSALLNFQLVTGYFEGYENLPFEVEVVRPKSFFGATAIQKKILNDTTEILSTSNYGSLIDQPVLYAEPDTTSFKIDEHRFNIAVHSEDGKNSALELKSGIKKIVESISDYSGFTSNEDYTFIFYFIKEQRLKGILKTFGVDAALEHTNSSVYCDLDYPLQDNFSYYNHVVPHEYFHTITPLGFHDDKITNFNFRKPDMSKHIWMYEGITDYFVFLLNAKYLSKNPKYDLRSAIDYSLTKKRQSMTESGRNIIRKNNVISWLNKMLDIENFYQKGKLIAMGFDIAIMENTNGNRRLIDVFIELKNEYENTAFLGDDLKDVLIRTGIPGVEDFYNRYIVGTEIPPYNEYLNNLGYAYYPAKSKLPSYGAFDIRKIKNDTSYYVTWAKKNSLGLKKGDSILKINHIPTHIFLSSDTVYEDVILNPVLTDTLSITYRRNGSEFNVKSNPSLQNKRTSKVLEVMNVSVEQRAYRNMFFGLNTKAK
ncbi:M61 family metallopeptidase [Zobellia nedashkovskayae]|uniref:M61 family metallopeptidase n=1 Tax=Zobellia nedashkovskayae TaxID=2779510 RepID=UPI00188A80C6|nr:hypothetical protein [Zobellia nedashkovskayae]